MSILLKNTYGALFQLFITGESELPSTEGTTQGDPIAMVMYALAVTPLISSLHHHQPDVSQAWFADDAIAAGQSTPFFVGGSNFSL